LNKSKFKS